MERDSVGLSERQRDAYLGRLGFVEREIAEIAEIAEGLQPAAGRSPAGAGGAERAREALDRLVWAHQTHVPFEDLSINRLHEPVQLDVEALFDKVVVRGRGGYCFELNLLFEALLRSLGFSVSPRMGRNMRNLPEGAVAPVMHRAEIVELGGERLYVDVGYGGPMAGCAIPVADGARVASGRHEFEVRRSDPGWWLVSYRSAGCAGGADSSCGGRLGDEDEGFKPVLAFQDAVAADEDFELLSWYAETHPTSPFVRNLILNLRTEAGNVSMRNGALTRVDDGDSTTTEVADADLDAVLREVFGLEI